MRLDKGGISKDHWNRLIPSVKGYSVVDSAVKKIMEGTCEACVYAIGKHDPSCQISKQNKVAMRVLSGEDLNAQEIKTALE